MLRLKTCCCCFSLHTGSLISGLIGILLAILSLLLMFLTSVEFKTIVLDWLPTWIVKIILAINLVMTVLISILLIVGVMKRNTFLMLPWVVLGIMLALGLLVSVLYTSIMFYVNKDVFNGSMWLVFGLIAVVIYIYMWTVVFSHFQDIREDEARGGYKKAPYVRGY